MNKNLRWKGLTIIVVLVVFSTIGVYPLMAQHYGWPLPGWLEAKALKLGLDLKGGVQLVLRVNTDDALRSTSVSTSEQLRESLTTSGITPASISVPAPTTFRVEGVPQDRDAEFRTAADEIAAANYDRNILGGGNYEFRLKPNIERDLREQTMEQTLQTIDRRVNALGVTEPSIARQQGEQILAQMPGVTDIARAKEIMGKTAVLEFKLVEAGPGSKEDLLKQYNGTLPGEMEILQGSGAESSAYYVVKKVAPVNGQDLRQATPGLDENNQPAVHFELKSEGARKFGKLSGENIGRNLAIVLDNRVVSAPAARGADHGSGPDQRRVYRGVRQRSRADPEVGRAAGLAHLPRAERGGPVARRRLHPIRAHRVGGRARADPRLHAHLLQAVGRERGGRPRLQPDHPARPDGLHRRDDDAARHRRLRAHDGRRRRLQRAHLRADQGGADGADAGCGPRSTRASTACS